MRIGLFTDTYTPDINGVVTSIVTLKNALEAQGHDVYVVTNHSSIVNTSYEDKVLRLPGVELKFLYGYVLSSPIHITALGIVREMDLDVIHVHSEFGIGIFARMAAKNLKVPLVSTYHTTYEDYTHYVNLLGLKTVDQFSKAAVARMSRFITKNVQVVIAPSEKTQQMLLRYSIKKEIRVIPTGLDLSRFKNRDAIAIATIKEKYGLDGHTVFLYVGRLAKEKSVDVVIDGFKALIDRGSSAKLLIVGGGPSDEDLKAQVKTLKLEEHVHFTGPIPSLEVINYYHSADIFTSASLTETQGLTYIEALACGLCVFARPDKPLEGIIEEGITGYLFTDSEMFAQKGVTFIDGDSFLKNKIKDNALAKAATFDSKYFADAILAAYRQASDIYYGKYRVETIDETDEGTLLITVNSKGVLESITLDEFLMGRKDVKVGDELSRVEINELEDDQDIYRGFQMALNQISKKDYTSFEIQTFLRSKTQLSQSQIDVVIDLLQRRRFLDDERYFKDRLDYERSLLKGNQKIAEGLIDKGFDSTQVFAALDAEDKAVYVARGLERADKVLNTMREGSKRLREDKVSQHLARQGFEYSIIKEIIEKLEDPIADDVELQSLRKVIVKAKDRYQKKYDSVKEVKNRVVKYSLSKGYDYDKIKEIMEDIDNEN